MEGAGLEHNRTSGRQKHRRLKMGLRTKGKSDGTVDKYTARLVARGFTQVYADDLFDTYSPVAKMASFRAILDIAARYDWDIESVN
jgi:hypothetical protein